MGSNSGIGFLNFMSFIFAIFSVVDSIVHIVSGAKDIEDSKNEKSTNIYIITLMVIRLLVSIIYIVLRIVSRRFKLSDFLTIFSSLIYSTTLAVVMILSCFVINFRDSTLSLNVHIIATYLASAVSFKLLVIQYLDEDEDNKFKKKSRFANVLRIFDQNLLAFSTLITVIIAVVIGAILRETNPEWNSRSIKYVGFIGEIFLRMLKCLILPLIFSSLVFAMGNLDTRLSGKIGLKIVIYYMGTTVLAIILGIILVLTIQPGSRSNEETGDLKPQRANITTTDTVLDLIRNLFPDNLVEACFSSYKTVLVPLNETYPNETDVEDWNITAGKSSGTNILGIVLFAIVFGVIIGQMREDGKVLVDFFRSFNNAMMTITEIVIHLTPIAVLFLVLPQILDVKELKDLLGSVGWYTLTVLIGLFFHGLVVLPLLYFIFTRKNPYSFLVNLSAALMTAFGTASSSATLPVTFQCLEEKAKIDKRIVRFCVPVGATINMDGTALYEAVAAIFIAQYRHHDLDFVQVIIITITATAASVGAAGIPQAGLITMVIVLNAVGLPVEDAALIFVIDWLIDRFRTAINVLGDAFGAGIVSHLSKKDLEKFNVND